MGNSKFKQTVEEILALADIQINGGRPYDITVHDERFYQRLLSKSTLGLGESYVDGWWDCPRIDEFIFRVMKAKLRDKAPKFRVLKTALRAKYLNRQTKSRASASIHHHYDKGNDLYRAMLGKRMAYSCGYWKDADNLDDAQDAKLDLCCRKLGLIPGMKVLDIGCGWGSFAKYATEKYDVEVVGVTISKEQLKLGQEMCKGLPVELRLQDYRDVSEKYDAIVSIGMFEHVGPKNYQSFFKKVDECLNDKGLFLLHTIGRLDPKTLQEPWTEKYIFPDSVTPAANWITKAAEEILLIEDWNNFGADYDKTLMAWYQNFNDNWDGLKNNYDERFKRMWDYFLLICAGSFRARKSQLWQIVFTRDGVEGGYKSIR